MVGASVVLVGVEVVEKEGGVRVLFEIFETELIDCERSSGYDVLLEMDGVPG